MPTNNQNNEASSPRGALPHARCDSAGTGSTAHQCRPPGWDHPGHAGASSHMGAAHHTGTAQRMSSPAPGPLVPLGHDEPSLRAHRRGNQHVPGARARSDEALVVVVATP